MVLPSNAVPMGDKIIMREIAALRREMSEGLASVAASFRPAVSFLLNQTQIAETTPPDFTTRTIDPANVETPWYTAPYDELYDARIVITTSSTGQLSFSLGGYLHLYSQHGATAAISLGLAINLADDYWTPVRYASDGDGPLTLLTSPASSSSTLQLATTGHVHLLSLAPDTTYRLTSCRMSKSLPGGGTSPSITVGWQGANLQVTKLGM